MLNVAKEITTVRGGAPEPLPARTESTGSPDLFTLARSAVEVARAATAGRGIFSRSRQLLPTGAWRGPRDAADSLVEEADLPLLGGLPGALEAGVRTVICTSVSVTREATAADLRCLWRVPFRADEPAAERLARLETVAALGREGVVIDGVVPTPEGEAMGLDTLEMFALCRLRTGVGHVLADFALLGHRLAQMALGFGADELLGPIVAERALRLGSNANNPAMTRKEAALLLRGAGLVPHERLSGGALEEVV